MINCVPTNIHVTMTEWSTDSACTKSKINYFKCIFVLIRQIYTQLNNSYCSNNEYQLCSVSSGACLGDNSKTRSGFPCWWSLSGWWVESGFNLTRGGSIEYSSIIIQYAWFTSWCSTHTLDSRMYKLKIIKWNQKYYDLKTSNS